MSLSGNHSGELASVCLTGFVTLLLSGGGAISLDKMVFRGGARKGQAGGASRGTVTA